MRVLFDHQTFTKKYGGISRYFFELIRHLDGDADFSWKLGLRYSDNAYLSSSPLFRLDKIPSLDEFCFGLNFKGKYKIYATLRRVGLIKDFHAINREVSIRMLQEGQYDIFHPTYYHPYFYGHLGKKPFVLTVYDMTHELYLKHLPRFSADRDATIKNKKLLAKKADAIIAISENTKRDIVRLYDIDPGKIKVIHLGNSLMYSGSSPNLKLPEKYILFIGTRDHHKNFRLFVRAMAPLLHQDESLHLVCGGGSVFNPEEIDFFASLSCSNRIIHREVEGDGTLVSLYKKALAFVFPSLYEGFGIPVLESFSCGCPVILSNTSSFPEVAADAAEYFNPEDEMSMIAAVKKMLYDEGMRAELRRRGFERLKYFSWEKTVSETKKVYESLL